MYQRLFVLTLLVFVQHLSFGSAIETNPNCQPLGEACKDTIVLYSGIILVGTYSHQSDGKIYYSSCGEEQYQKKVREDKVQSISKNGENIEIEPKYKSKKEKEEGRYKRIRKIGLILMLVGALLIWTVFMTGLSILPVAALVIGMVMFLISMNMKRKFKKKNDPSYSKNDCAKSIAAQVFLWLVAGLISGGAIFAWLYFGLGI